MIIGFSEKTVPREQEDLLLPSTSHLDSRRNSIPRAYVGVDVFKFFFAVCIVALHTNALSFMPYTANYMFTKVLLRMAVPYFFVASGFFLGNKLLCAPKEQYSHIICAYCRRLIKPLCIFETVSLLYYGFVFLQSGKGLFKTVLNLGRSVLFYPYGALWYIQACIVGALLLYPFIKRDRLNLAIATGIPLYGFALIANNYSFLIIDTAFQDFLDIYFKICVSVRNGLFTGFISLSLGVVCSKINDHACKTKRYYMGWTFCFFIVYIAEIIFIYTVNKTPLDDGGLYISHLFFAPALFLTTLHLNFPISQNTAVLLRNLSTGIYFLHRPILYIVGYFTTVGWLSFLIVLSSAIVICLFTYKTHLKFLYPLLK